MKRVVLVLLMLAIGLALLPGLAVATEAASGTAKTTAAPSAAATSTLITYPEAPELASAEEAKAETEWSKAGDGLNLIVALLSLGAIGGIIAWGIIAQRRITA